MPPHVPRKHLRDPSPIGEGRTHKRVDTGKEKAKASQARRPTLYDDLDATNRNLSQQSNPLLKGLVADDDDDSELSSLSDGDFENVPIADHGNHQDDESDGDEDIEFEDVPTSKAPAKTAPKPAGVAEITINKDLAYSLSDALGSGKGPSKRDRAVRNGTHRVHVLLLLWHNAIRNSWLCDLEVQAIMISHVPPRLWDEVDRWRRNSGLEVEVAEASKKSSQRGVKVKGKEKEVAGRGSKDWNSAAERLEEGVVDLSHGDPLFRLMKSLVAWWKQRFKVSAPGIRKRGYMSLQRLASLTKTYDGDPHDPDNFGERHEGIEDVRTCAQQCTGSRDIGSQLFTALLRALGMEARMVASLQPVGFGWSKLDDASPESESCQGIAGTPAVSEKGKDTNGTQNGNMSRRSGKSNTLSSRQTRRRSQQVAADPVEDSDEFKIEGKHSDDEPVIEVQVTPRKASPTKKYDADLEFPHYWTEVLSPVTQKYLAVDPIVKSIIATNRELVESLEPRGGKADKAKQVIAYVVGFSPDGTAKDVTVRYLKRQMLPGRTKGMRVPIEKVPVYNRHGKVKRYEQFDWFKSAMRGYLRGGKKTPITEIDEIEDSTELKPAKLEKKEVKEGEETLQYYKSSKEFALERHLKREEALLPNAPPVKIFRSKGKGGQIEEENVYLRSDVVQVKSAETWHKQGRAPVPGERPLKSVPYRAATINRRREIAEAERASGQKVLQGLYSFEQTEWIIPPPIQNGIIPKNEYGNIDLFVEHMCPRGAVHVPFRGAMRVCKRLQIDFAEAVVDFEFGHRMAVPVIQGVVIAEENHDMVMEELQKDEAERTRKEDEKRVKGALGSWRKFLMGMRIAERIRQDYGQLDEGVEIFGHRRQEAHAEDKAVDEDTGGGFLPEGYEMEGEEKEEHLHQKSGFFACVDEDDDGEDPFVVEYHGHGRPQDELALAEPDASESKAETNANAESAPRAATKTRKVTTRETRKSIPRRRRRRATSDDEDEDVDEDECDPDWDGEDER
jgi:xeroderma pigmentosum group C-complementing protein